MTSIDQPPFPDNRPSPPLADRRDRRASTLLRSAAGAVVAVAVAALLSQGRIRAGLAAAAAIAVVVQLVVLIAPLSRRALRTEAAALRWGRTTIGRARSRVGPKIRTLLTARSWRDRRPRSAWWRARRKDLAATFAVCSALIAPIYLRLAHDPLAQVITNNDVYLHIDLAERMQRWPPNIPHPVFHYLYLAGKPLLGAHWAPLVPVLVATAMMAAGLVRLGATSVYGRRGLHGGAVAAFAAITIITDGPTVLLSATGIIAPTPELIAHVWWSPTMLLVFGSSLLLIPYVAELVAAAPPASPTHSRLRKLGLLVLGLAVLSTLARPNLTFALVPGLLLYLVRDRRWGRTTLGAAARWFIIPTAVTYLWQTSVVLANYSNLGGTTINPFYEMSMHQMFVKPWFFYLPLLPVVAAAVVGRARFLREPVVFLTFQALWVATALMVLVDDSGVDQNAHGVYVLPFTACWLVLWVLTVRFWVGELITARQAGPSDARRFRFILAGTVLWVAGGVVSHLTAMGVHRFAVI